MKFHTTGNGQQSQRMTITQDRQLEFCFAWPVAREACLERASRNATSAGRASLSRRAGLRSVYACALVLLGLASEAAAVEHSGEFDMEYLSRTWTLPVPLDVNQGYLFDKDLTQRADCIFAKKKPVFCSYGGGKKDKVTGFVTGEALAPNRGELMFHECYKLGPTTEIEGEYAANTGLVGFRLLSATEVTVQLQGAPEDAEPQQYAMKDTSNSLRQGALRNCRLQRGCNTPTGAAEPACGEYAGIWKGMHKNKAGEEIHTHLHCCRGASDVGNKTQVLSCSYRNGTMIGYLEANIYDNGLVAKGDFWEMADEDPLPQWINGTCERGELEWFQILSPWFYGVRKQESDSILSYLTWETDDTVWNGQRFANFTPRDPECLIRESCLQPLCTDNMFLKEACKDEGLVLPPGVAAAIGGGAGVFCLFLSYLFYRKRIAPGAPGIKAPWI